MGNKIKQVPLQYERLK